MRGQSERPNPARYDSLSRYYDVLIDPVQRRFRGRGIDRLDAATGETVLDVGCGTGRGLATLRRAVGPTGHVVGLDAAARMCRRTRSRLGDRASVVRGDAVRLPFRTDRFDAVLVSFTLELFGDDARSALLEELHRVLGPHGRICIIAPTESRDPFGWLYAGLNHAMPTLVDSRPVDVREELIAAGFRLDQIVVERVVVVPVAIVTADPTS